MTFKMKIIITLSIILTFFGCSQPQLKMLNVNKYGTDKDSINKIYIDNILFYNSESNITNTDFIKISSGSNHEYKYTICLNEKEQKANDFYKTNTHIEEFIFNFENGKKYIFDCNKLGGNIPKVIKEVKEK